MSLYNGTPPKDEEARQRRNAPTFDKIQVRWDGETRGPSLPRGIVWGQRTKDWWKTWRQSPQAMVMHDTDWETMLEAALLHNRFWDPECPDTARNAIAAELRRRVAAFGATFEDRLKLRMSVNTPQSEQATEAAIQETAKATVNYMERLTKAAAEAQGD